MREYSKVSLVIAFIIFGFLLSGCTSRLQQGTAINTQSSLGDNAPKDNLNSANVSIDNSNSSDANISVSTPQTNMYTLDDIARHNNVNNCWMAIHGKVYDVTSYIGMHPGGPVIIDGCGKDATSLFESKPGTGNPHSQNARSMMDAYYVGELKI